MFLTVLLFLRLLLKNVAVFKAFFGAAGLTETCRKSRNCRKMEQELSEKGRKRGSLRIRIPPNSPKEYLSDAPHHPSQNRRKRSTLRRGFPSQNGRKESTLRRGFFPQSGKKESTLRRGFPSKDGSIAQDGRCDRCIPRGVQRGDRCIPRVYRVYTRRCT